MKIEAGKYYRTRDGRKIQVLSVNGEPPYVVLGAECRRKGLSCCGRWALDGRSHICAGESPDDLVAEWVDKPEFDWSVIPPWLNYLAMDRDGRWNLFQHRPTFGNYLWSQNEADHDEDGLASINPIPKKFAPRWTGRPEDSLVERNPAK